jgi:hypothetical protein
VAADWTSALARLEAMGLAAFLFREAPEGGWHFDGQFRTADPARRHRIASGPAATRAEAVQLALAAAERWAAGSK